MNLLCLLGWHRYDITQILFKRSGKNVCSSSDKHRFLRECDCGKTQILRRPDKYDPSRYFWHDWKEGDRIDHKEKY
jgi:hypothetical protein